jgi:hypothetical protein
VWNQPHRELQLGCLHTISNLDKHGRGIMKSARSTCPSPCLYERTAQHNALLAHIQSESHDISHSFQLTLACREILLSSIQAKYIPTLLTYNFDFFPPATPVTASPLSKKSGYSKPPTTPAVCHAPPSTTRVSPLTKLPASENR